MEINKPLRIVLFIYDTLRLLFLAVAFSLFPTVQAAMGTGIFPYMVYLSSNTLFPMICLFLMIKPAQYRNYLPLYMTGKTIAVIIFLMWAAFSLAYEISLINIDINNYFEIMALLGGVFIIGLADAISIFGIFLMNKKPPEAAVTVIKDDAEPGVNGGM
ncbi:MAG: hypothetical protein FWD78_10090 [Treponema sp.]|nr:hypothetical protein [Treponema sp.]